MKEVCLIVEWIEKIVNFGFTDTYSINNFPKYMNMIPTYIRYFSISAIIVFWTLQSFNIYGQTYKMMTPSVYSEWNRLKNIKISDSAEIVMYMLDREIGDKQLVVYDSKNNVSHKFERVNKAQLDISGNYIIFSHGLAYDSIRTLKRKKTPQDKMPLDSLSIFNVQSHEKITITNVKDFSTPSKYSGFCFYTKIPETQNSKDSLPQNEKKKKKTCDDSALFIRNLSTGHEDTIQNVKDYTFAEKSAVVAYAQCIGDSVAKYNISLKYLKKDSTVRITNDLFEIKNISLDSKGLKLVFLGLEKKSDELQKPYNLYLKNPNDNFAARVSDNFLSIPVDHNITADKKISWSESDKRFFFGIAPLRPEKDTSKLDDEIVNVEIWYHDSPRLFTQMESTLEDDRKKSYQVMYDTDSNSFDQLENDNLERSILSKKGDGRYILLLKSKPYQKAVTWNGESLKDLILFDTETKTTTLISTAESGNPVFSPEGRFVYWWSRPDSIWKTFDTQKSILSYLGLWSISKFQDEENDVPALADAYGIAGWLPGDKAAIVYDRYDLWSIDPTDPFNYKSLTNGRNERIVNRMIDLDKENENIDSEEKILLHQYNEITRGESYSWLDLNTGQISKSLGGLFSLTKNVIKAPKNNQFIFTKEDFATFPDLLLSDSDFNKYKKISDVNPQQKDYGWGSAKLFSWTNYNGQKNDGMVFYPPFFNPEKKYPLIVNFYERSSEGIFKHRAPEAHRSSINYTYYTNLGYVIFNPDIKYVTGQPGDDCYNAVESGVDALLKSGYIDPNRMALQGHSWGGYQIAYLLTKTGRYTCAEAGAPVVNMVSAYGGIRWESGMSRMFQYEKSQSRLGATLWENPEMYHKNSPIYELPKVTTPVLILHNDGDGAVPWYQGIEYYMALRRLGKPAWLLNYNGEPHWPVKWQNRLDFNIRLEQFFNHFLMDGPLPLWMKEGNTPIEKGILDKY